MDDEEVIEEKIADDTEIKEDTKVEINPGKIRVDKVETGKITTKEVIKEEVNLGKTKEARVAIATGRITTIEEESPLTKEENLSNIYFMRFLIHFIADIGIYVFI